MRMALLGSVVVAALGGLLFGFDTAVISGTTDWLHDAFVVEMTAQVQAGSLHYVGRAGTERLGHGLGWYPRIAAEIK